MTKKRKLTAKIILSAFVCLTMAVFILIPLVSADAAIEGLDMSGRDPLGLPETGSISVLIGRAIQAFLGIIGALTLGVVVYGGFFILTSSGKSEWIKRGWEVIRYGFVGLVFILGSYALLNFVIEGLSGEGELKYQQRLEAREEAEQQCLDECIAKANEEVEGFDDPLEAVIEYCIETSCSSLYAKYNEEFREADIGDVESSLEAAKAGAPTGRTESEWREILSFLYCRDECLECLLAYDPPTVDEFAGDIEQNCQEKIVPETGKCEIPLSEISIDFDSVIEQHCPLVYRREECRDECEPAMKRACYMDCIDYFPELAEGVTFAQNLPDPPVDLEVNEDFCLQCCEEVSQDICKDASPPNCITSVNTQQFRGLLDSFCGRDPGIGQYNYFDACYDVCEIRMTGEQEEDCYGSCYEYFDGTLEDEWQRVRYCEKECCSGDGITSDLLVSLHCNKYKGLDEGGIPTGERPVLDEECGFEFGNSGWPSHVYQYCPRQGNSLYEEGCLTTCELEVEGDCEDECVNHFRYVIDEPGDSEYELRQYCGDDCCNLTVVTDLCLGGCSVRENAKKICPDLIDFDGMQCRYTGNWSAQFNAYCPEPDI